MSDRFIDHKLDRAWRLLARWVAEDRIPAASAVVGSSEEVGQVHSFGRQTLDADARDIGDDAIFLIASPSKPITALAVMMLVEEGAVKLIDRVADFVPEFAGRGKRTITLAQCLTHTSGLCDMLSDNIELRERGAPLSEFLARVCELAPDFLPGRAVQYQSTGFLMLSEVVARVSGRPLAEFLRERVFEPLEMRDTSLGMPPDWEQEGGVGEPRRDRIVEIRPGDWSGARFWNTDYWRRLGAPWGGVLSTPADLGRLCRHLLEIHDGRDGIISPPTLAAMTRNQLERWPDLPEATRRCYPWGLGWQLNWPTHETTFGDLLSLAAYGHWGAAGTLVWIDPARDAFAVVLTSQPLESGRRLLANLTNALCAALA